MTDKPMTVGDIRFAIKDLPDDMPIYVDTEDDYMAVFTIKESCLVETWKSFDNPLQIRCLVLGIT